MNNNKYNAILGNWKKLDLKSLRLKPNITYNKGFFSSFTYILHYMNYLYSITVNIFIPKQTK